MQCLTIPLTQGQSTIINLADHDLVRPYHWWTQRYPSGDYAVTKIRQPDGRRLLVGMHRIIMCAPPDLEVDHRNGDTLDNRHANLRLCTRLQNAANRSPQSNRSGYKGVTHKGPRYHSKPWCAAIRKDKRLYHLGMFATPEEAARAYDDAARALFGPFARCNFPQ